MSTTGEYTQFFGGSVTNALSGVVATVNRVNQVYETDLSVRMVPIPAEASLIFTSASSDPFDNNVFADVDSNQTFLDGSIGSAAYDVGHVLSTDPGGGYAPGLVGIDGEKAKGATGSDDPQGDPYHIDYVAHELGHEFGANHTFSFNYEGTGGQYEPGSGSTIMGYAGVTGPDDLQDHSDPVFHSGSFDQVLDQVDNVVPNVGTRTPTGNGLPTVGAGADYTIPARTPFALTAVGSDPNGDALTYSWEERDSVAVGGSSLGDIGIAIIAGAATGQFSGLPNLAATTPPGQLVSFDNGAPVATFAPAAPGLTAASSFPVTLSFSEPVTAITAGALRPVNATVANFTRVNATTYTFDLKPTADGPFNVSLPSGATADPFGNSNTLAAVDGTPDGTLPTAAISPISGPVTRSSPAFYRPRGP